MRDEHEMRVGFEGDQKTVKVNLPDGDISPWDLDTKFRVVGRDTQRIDAIAKVTGAAKYAFDMRLEGMLEGVMVRSKIPSGRVTKVDLDAARKMPGVRAVVLLKDPTGRRTRVRFVGDAIAAIAADTRDQALDALERVAVEYERTDATIDYLRSEDAPDVDIDTVRQAWDGKGEDRMREELAGCKHTREGTWRCEVQTHSSLESHGHVCAWDETNGRLEAWSSTQATFGTRQGLARALNISPDRIRVHSEFVGGGFGSKFSAGAEGVACARLSVEAKAPVKLMLDRFEEHTCAGNRPSALMQIRAGVDAEGTIAAWDYRSWGGPGYSKRGGATRFPRHYLAKAHVREQQTNLASNTDAGRAMRAPGYPQGYFAAEGMIDALAESVGADPIAFRRRNDPRKLRGAEWELGAAKFGWVNRWRPWGARDLKQSVLRGAGVSSAFWGQMGNKGRGTPNSVTCKIHSDGTVESRNGAQDIGTGMKTVLAILTAEELQLPAEAIHVTMGDTQDPIGPASGGSTTTPSLAPAARLAAAMAKAGLCELVAEHLAIQPSDVTVRDGRWGAADGKTLSFADACKLLGTQTIERTGQRFDNYQGYLDNVCGCQFAEVEIDTQTGLVRVLELLAVQDCGLVIAKNLAESQVLGAMVGGLSYALLERRVVDRDLGRMLNGDFLHYKIAGSRDMPKMTAMMFSVANGKNNVGAAGLGEPPAVATPASIANAVSNAIGAPIRSLPITPDKVLSALATARGSQNK